jgi:hypothetical protein
VILLLRKLLFAAILASSAFVTLGMAVIAGGEPGCC